MYFLNPSKRNMDLTTKSNGLRAVPFTILLTFSDVAIAWNMYRMRH